MVNSVKRFFLVKGQDANVYIVEVTQVNSVPNQKRLSIIVLSGTRLVHMNNQTHKMLVGQLNNAFDSILKPAHSKAKGLQFLTSAKSPFFGRSDNANALRHEVGSDPSR